MERFLETLFRFKWLLLFLFIAPSASGAYYVFSQRTVFYQSSATIWAERPTFFGTISDWNQWVSAASNQAGNVNELLQTQSFDIQLLQQTSFRDQLKTVDGQTKAIANLKKRVYVGPTSDHVIRVVAADERPAVAVELATAVINSSMREMLQHANSDSSSTLEFYQKELETSNAKLTDTTAALQSYLNVHPELTAPSPSQGKAETQFSTSIGDAAFAAQHPELVRLAQQRDAAEKDVQSLQTQILQIRFAQSSYSTSSNQSFRVIDLPSAPILIIDSKKTLATKLGLVAGGGLAIMMAGLVLLTLLDTTVRSEQLAAQRFQLPVFTALPYIREKRGLFRRSRIKGRSVPGLLAYDARRSEFSVVKSPEQA